MKAADITLIVRAVSPMLKEYVARELEADAGVLRTRVGVLEAERLLLIRRVEILEAALRAVLQRQDSRAA
jgi:hypothetical protein